MKNRSSIVKGMKIKCFPTLNLAEAEIYQLFWRLIGYTRGIKFCYHLFQMQKW